ncbi:MAG: hypothetical protein JXR95_11935 [Deltaproteobacteria bacterium]|nr:hypothetical protein [Deltaproteobacteria bacterium]
MRTFVGLLGLAVVGAAVFLGVNSGMDAHALYKKGEFSLDVMNSRFWLVDPSNYVAGIAPNGKWLLKGFGAIVLFFVGRHIQNQSAPMNDGWE